MRKIRYLIILTATVALALSATPGNPSHAAPSDDHHLSHDKHPSHADHLAGGHTHSEIHTHHDHVALDDMHAFAAQHYGEVHEHQETSGSVLEWSPDWELRWIDFDTPEHVIRIYHATHRNDPGSRFISTWNHLNGHYEPWTRIH